MDTLENQETAQPHNLKKTAFVNGVLWALLSIIIFLITYYVAPGFLGSMVYNVLLFGVILGLAIFFILDLRKKAGGYWNFREALSGIFILFFVYYLLFTLFTTVFGKWIEPAYTDIVRDQTLNRIVEVAETFSTDQDQIDKAIEEAEKALDKQLNPTFAQFTQGLALNGIFCFIFALIFAAIFKRSKPVFASIE